MHHIAEKEISAYVDGQLNPSDSRLVEQHLSACPECSASCKEMQQLTKIFRSAQNLDPSPYLWSKIMQQADSLPAKRPWRITHILWPRKPIWAAAAVIMILIGVFSAQHQIQTLIWRHELKGIDDVRLVLSKKNKQENNPFTAALTGDRSSKPLTAGKTELQSNPFSATWR